MITTDDRNASKWNRRTIWIHACLLAMPLMVVAPLLADVRQQDSVDAFVTAERSLERGDHADAERWLKLALDEDPFNARAHFLLGVLLAQDGQLDESIVGFQHATKISPGFAPAHYNLGTALLRRDEPRLAAQELEAALDLRPEHVPTYNNLAKAYFLTGLPELALAAYQKALQLNPEDGVALRNLALLQREAAAAADADAGDTAPIKPGTLTDRTESAEVPVPEPAIAKALDDLRAILRDFPNVTVEWRGDQMVLGGWTSGPAERALLDKVLQGRSNVLDLSGDDVGDPNRLVEVDATIFKVIGIDSESVGHNFLKRVEVNASLADASLAGFGWAYSAAINYEVEIANAIDDNIAFLARPHLTALSGTTASFVAGGDIVYQVSGLNSGDIKPYPFGTTLEVTPTALRSTDDDGAPRIRVTVKAGRRTILPINDIEGAAEGSTVFENISVTSEAVLGLGQTLILTGLSQRESRVLRSGVPGLRSIPVIKYLFSEKTVLTSDLAIIILLTPRDPAYWDERNREEAQSFIERRRAYIQAARGTEQDMEAFRKKYPDWYKIAPNHLVTHFYMLENSEAYRKISGMDLADEDLEINLIGPTTGRR